MKGKVYLVGAGPGDTGLITVKAMDKIKEADAIVYDQLANPSLLQNAKKACEMIYVGKKSGCHTLPQFDINELLVKLSKEGKMVVRLKGGDPYVFGRGGEEGEILEKNNISFEVIPGITSAIGGLAYAGIPITHRDCASSFHVITGHLKSQDKELNWESLAKLEGTLVFLMGIGNLEKICNNLMLNGKNANTPTAIIQRATTSLQKVVVGNLSNIVNISKEEKIKPPGLIVIGDVVKKRDKLSFFDNKPLFGKNIIVTRSRAQASSLLTKIEELGGNALQYPTIKINAIQQQLLMDKINDIQKYTHIILTSVNGVEIFFDTLFEMKKDSRILSNLKVTAIGSETAKKIRNYGILADYIPEKFVGEEIVETLRSELKDNDSILIPRSKNARPYLVDELSKICNVDELFIYETLKEDINRQQLIEEIKNNKIEYITFTSSSTVENFIEILGQENLSYLDEIKIISIGPITSKKIESYDLKVYKQAEEYTIDGMINSILEGEDLCYQTNQQD